MPVDGVVMAGGRRLRIGRAHAGRTVTIIIEDAVFRVMDGDVELSTRARTSDRPIRQFKAVVRRRKWPPSVGSPSLARRGPGVSRCRGKRLWRARRLPVR
ncbi:hypothetical protein GCM10010424_73700 [Streptomyces lienomycini]